MRPTLLLTCILAIGLGVDAWHVFLAHPAPSCPSEAALVMGAAQYDGTPSPAFERRLRAALDLYASGCVERVVVSGGGQPGDRTTEGAAGRAWLIAHGVDAAAVTAETRASDTIENVRLGAELLGDGSVVIVTDDVHLYRSLWLARRAGLDASGMGARTGREGRLAYGLRELAVLAFYRVAATPP